MCNRCGRVQMRRVSDFYPVWICFGVRLLNNELEMELVMSAPTPAVANLDRSTRYFSLADAQRALPYVRRVVGDICQAYRQAVDIQHRLDQPTIDDQADSLRKQYDRLMDQLNRYVDELRDVGVELKDYDRGLVDFPAHHEGREVLLCWKLGETDIIAWHEKDAGFAGRQDVKLLDSNAKAAE
jgi:hypothetical protein